MIAKGYTNIRAMIETQYGILSQMIMDIAYRYQTQLKQNSYLLLVDYKYYML